MRKTIILYLLLCLNQLIYGQINKALFSNINTYVPFENVILKTNADVVFTGENLYYKIYCLLDKTNTYSNISKIAYVELVGVNSNIVFKHKLKLENGVSQGDFFIPSNVKTGQYKLLAYTNWTKNNSINSFYEQDIYIINPYSSKHQIPIKNTTDENEVVQIELDEERIPNNSPNASVLIETFNTTQKTREKVTLNLVNNTKDNGNYSLSVRKVDKINIINKNPNINNIQTKNEVFYIPEIRGELLSGRIESLKKNVKVSDKTISLSIPDKNFIFKNVKTNSSGQFFFSIYENYSKSNAIIQVHAHNKEDYKILIDNPTFIDYSLLKFKPVSLSPKLENWIKKRSIDIQVENAYFSSKTDSTLMNKVSPPFYNHADKTYILDDYKRFPTLKETFIEVIYASSIKKEGDSFDFVVYDYENVDYNKNSNLTDQHPLVLIDGILIQDSNDIINYSSNKIRSISIVFGNYLYGSIVYNGILAFETIKGDFTINDKGEYIKNIELFKPLDKKYYYNPAYTTPQTLKRIPDYRSQLYWDPNVNLNKEYKILSFFTSDILGIYEVRLEGFTEKGQYIMETKYFNVVK